MWYKTIGTTTLIVAMSLLSGCGGGGGSNHSPVANDDAASATRGGAVMTIDVLANDTDEDNNTLSIKSGSLSTPTHGGTVTLSGNKITYTPPASYSGTETFDYTVTDGHGGEDTATVTVTIARKWEGARLIETDSADTYSPRIAMDASGNALAVWIEDDSSHSYLYANRYTVGHGWGTREQIDKTSSPDERPQLAMNAQGKAFAVWQQKGSSLHFIYANRFDPSGGWGSAQQISTSSADAKYPQIAVDANGNAIAVWAQTENNYIYIYASRYTASNGSWGTPQKLENITGVASDPTVVMDQDGNALVAWIQPSSMVELKFSKDTSHGWETPQTIAKSDHWLRDPQLAFDADGNALAVWHQDDGIRDNIWANRYAPGGWGVAQKIENNNQGGAYDPQIAMDDSGNGLAVWKQSDGSHFNIWSNHYVAGEGWGTAKIIETDNNGNAFSPQIVMDKQGNGIAIWSQSDGTRDNIWANRYSAGSGWGTAELVETDDRGDALSPDIAIDGKGNAIAVWRQWDGAHNNIMSNRFW